MLTGERKRNHQRHASLTSNSSNTEIKPQTPQHENSQSTTTQNNTPSSVITAEIPSDGQPQKVHLVPVAGTSGLYSIASSWWDSQQSNFSAEFLSQFQQGDLLEHSQDESNQVKR